MRLLSVALLTIAVAPRAASADCEFNPRLDTTVITKSGTAVADRGGFLVAQLPARTPRTLQAKAKQVHTVQGATAKQRTLAPGLVVFDVAFTNSTYAELVDGDGVIVSRVIASEAKLTPYAAPAVKTMEMQRARRFFGPRITLTKPVPADAYALVIADVDGTPREFMPAMPGANEIMTSRSECQVAPDGTLETKQGDKLVAFWVNTHGRVSAKTKPFIVGTSK